MPEIAYLRAIPIYIYIIIGVYVDVIVPRASFGRLGLCVVASLLLVALFRSVALGGHCLGVVGLSLCLRQFLPLDRPCILGLGRGFL